MASATPHDTIVAVSSPPGASRRGLVRLAGPEAFTILARMSPDPLPEPRQLARLALRLPAAHPDATAAPRSLPILAAVFRGPASYTGQDMAELQCPGQPALLE